MSHSSLSSNPVHEGHVGEETILVLGVSDLGEQLEQLHVVVVGSLGVGSGSGSLHFLDNFVKLAELLPLLVGLTKTHADLLGGVHAESVHDVTEEEHVEF